MPSAGTLARLCRRAHLDLGLAEGQEPGDLEKLGRLQQVERLPFVELGDLVPGDVLQHELHGLLRNVWSAWRQADSVPTAS